MARVTKGLPDLEQLLLKRQRELDPRTRARRAIDALKRTDWERLVLRALFTVAAIYLLGSMAAIAAKLWIDAQ